MKLHALSMVLFSMGDKRKHIRVSHKNRVTFVMGGHTLVGETIDISKSGMLISANIQEANHAVQSVSLTLPKLSERLHIQCESIWKNNKNDHEYNLGIKFSHKTETQVMHINTFIDDLIQTKSTNNHETNDNRIVPRTICLLTKVFSKKKDIFNISIDNI